MLMLGLICFGRVVAKLEAGITEHDRSEKQRVGATRGIARPAHLLDRPSNLKTPR